MTLPIIWNQDLEMWDVKTPAGKVLWSGRKYSDATQFAEDYASQLGIQAGLQPNQ